MVSRYVFFLAVITALTLAGCKAAHTSTPPAFTGETLKLTSGAFEDGQRIPVEFTCDGEDGNPDLAWQDIPEKTRSLALIVSDPDAPGGTFYHWALYNISPDQTTIAQNLTPESSFFATANNDFRKPGYRGPCPPGKTEHRYFFDLYALDTMLEPGSLKSARDVEQALQGHILAQGRLTGRYGR